MDSEKGREGEKDTPRLRDMLQERNAGPLSRELALPFPLSSSSLLCVLGSAHNTRIINSIEFVPFSAGLENCG